MNVSKTGTNSLWVVWAEDDGLAVWVWDVDDIDDRLDGWLWLSGVTYESGCLVKTWEGSWWETIGIVDTGGEVLTYAHGVQEYTSLSSATNGQSAAVSCSFQIHRHIFGCMVTCLISYVQWLQVDEPVCDHITHECHHSYAIKQQWVQMHFCCDELHVVTLSLIWWHLASLGGTWLHLVALGHILSTGHIWLG